MNLRGLLKEYKYDSDFIYEGLILDISTKLKRLMEKKGVTKKQLAERMDVSPSYVTKIFGGSNISFKTLAKVLAALEIDATISIGEWGKKEEIIHSDDMIKVIKVENLRKKDEAGNIHNLAA